VRLRRYAMSASGYDHLLLAVDFEPASEPAIERAARLRMLFGARLSLLHVTELVTPAAEYMPLGFSGDIAAPDEMALEQELIQSARRQLDVLGERLGVAGPDRLVRVGSVGPTIDETAEEIGADLGVIGRRGSHGFLGLLGSTAKSVLRSIKCDVLCVKIGGATGA
jgi:universal stress protein A